MHIQEIEKGKRASIHDKEAKGQNISVVNAETKSNEHQANGHKATGEKETNENT
jgi:hypothetical protein